MDARVDHRTDIELGGAPEGLDALIVAERLKAAGCVGLFSRSGVLPESAQGVAAAIQAAGCALVLLKGDVTKEADVAAALTELRAQGLPLRGVFHTAGILDDGVFDGLTEERLRRVMDPKVAGAWILDRLTGDDPLAFLPHLDSVLLVLQEGATRAQDVQRSLDALQNANVIGTVLNGRLS